MSQCLFFFSSLLLLLLLLQSLVLFRGAQATVASARRQELDGALRCYAQYAPELMDAFSALAPKSIANSVDAFARQVGLITQSLRAGRSPCDIFASLLLRQPGQTLTRAQVAAQCTARLRATDAPIPVSAPLQVCLRNAHELGLAMMPLSAANEETLRVEAQLRAAAQAAGDE